MNDPLHDPNFPDRPQHPDFWRLSEIILKQDGRVEDITSLEDANDMIPRMIQEQIDQTSLEYMSMVRSHRMLDSLRKAGLPFYPEVAMTSMFLQGVLVGIEFQKAGGHRDG